MSWTVKSLKVTYNPINEKDIFTNGDCISGQVTLEVAKECRIKSLFVKFKGKARCLWFERYGEVTLMYYSKEKYFSVRHYFIWGEDHKGDDNQRLLTTQQGEPYTNVVAPGCHVYPFIFQFPLQDIPSSFKGSVGKIVYTLEARLSRSMRIPKKYSTKIIFVEKADPCRDPYLMECAKAPQHESKDKKLIFLNSGTVAMDVDIEKSGFFPGEGIKVVAYIHNNSTRDIKPKYCVYSKHSFFAQGKTKVDIKDLIKEVGEPIPPSANETVIRVITIPHDLKPSITNCSIIKVEYRLRVYLDVKYAFDPEVKFPIVIWPASQVPDVAPPPAASGFGFEPVGSTNPPTCGIVPPQPPVEPQPMDPPPAYGASGMSPPSTDLENSRL